MKVAFTESCWLWMAGRHADGYGLFRINGTTRRAHRLAYEESFGAIPRGLTLDHLCRNRACVNPAHLEACTNQENILRGTAPSADHARQTHCRRGHELAGDNLYVWRGPSHPNGMRQCKRCGNERRRGAR